MKILFMTWKDLKHPLAGGAEVVNEELARRLVADGHDVHFLVGGFKGGETHDTSNGYKITRLGNRYTLYWHAAKYYKKHLRGWADAVVEEVNTLPFFTRFYVKEPRVLFFHQLCRQIWFYQLPQPLSLTGYLVEPVYLRLLGRSPVITVSDSAKQDLIRHGFKQKDISIIAEGIHTKPIKSLSESKKSRQPTLLSFGALRAMKRTLHHIEAFDIAKKSMPNLRLKIAGASEAGYGDKVQARIKRSPFANDIEYLGRVSEAQKLQLFRQCHALLMTSVKEGWGLVVTEAASQGTPAVVYDVDGLRDSVRHLQTGIVTKTNPKALAEGVIELLKNKHHYDTMRHNGWRWSHEINFNQCYQDFKNAMEIA